MNTLLIIVVAVVGFCYFGGNKCPKALKENKEMLLGVLVGLALCSFMGVRLEGVNNSEISVGGRLEISPDVVINQMGGDAGLDHTKENKIPVIYIKENSNVEFKSGNAGDDASNMEMTFSSMDENGWNNMKSGPVAQVNNDYININGLPFKIIVLSESDFKKKRIQK